MQNKIPEIFDLDLATVSRFTSGFTIPILVKMHFGSAGSDQGGLDWSRYPLSDACTDDQLARFVHYNEALPSLRSCNFFGKTVLVIGSSVPWLECYLARQGATKITTVEYRPVIWQPQFAKASWDFLTFDKFIAAKPQPYDVVISYSSIEHSGLGRYGDDINPDGDLETLQLASRWLSDRASVYLALPVGPDLVFFNRHRVYGPKRLAILERLLDRPIKRLVLPVDTTGAVIDPSQVWSLNFAFAQPVGYDRQLLLEFGKP